LTAAGFDTFTFAVFMQQRPLTANNLSANIGIPPLLVSSNFHRQDMLLYTKTNGLIMKTGGRGLSVLNT